MYMRGPDAHGEWVSPDKQVIFGHQRLSILDLQGGEQPMTSSSGRYTICYNGEIYNFKDLREYLIQKGYQFKTCSDTEVILNLYDFKKEKMFLMLRGMFAFTIWDQQQKKMILARDPYGIKPLYYSSNQEVVYVASQVKALRESSRISDKRSIVAKVGFLLTGSIPEPHTSYEDISQVPSGSYMVVDQNGLGDPVPYANLDETILGTAEGKKFETNQECQSFVREKLIESIRYHLVSDVPVGIFLSSGIDSACILALANEVGIKDITTITLGYDEFLGTPNDERPLAKKISEMYCTNHIEATLRKNDFMDELPKAMKAMDQPSIDGLNTYFVSKKAREHGLKVALSGVGADELFGGYPSFHRLPSISLLNNLLKIIPGSEFIGKTGIRCFSKNIKPLRSKWEKIFDRGSNSLNTYFLIRGLFCSDEIGSWIKSDELKYALEKLNYPAISYKEKMNESIYKKIVVFESKYYLRNQLLKDSDWAGMANSVEIRTPFVDYHLLSELSTRMSNKWTWAGKRYVANAPQPSLPKFIVKRKKSGFEIPIQNWLQIEADQMQLSEPQDFQIHWSQKWAIKILKEYF